MLIENIQWIEIRSCTLKRGWARIPRQWLNIIGPRRQHCRQQISGNTGRFRRLLSRVKFVWFGSRSFSEGLSWIQHWRLARRPRRPARPKRREARKFANYKHQQAIVNEEEAQLDERTTVRPQIVECHKLAAAVKYQLEQLKITVWQFRGAIKRNYKENK